MNYELIDLLYNTEYGNRSNTKKLQTKIIELGFEADIADIIIETLAVMTPDLPSLTAACNKVGTRCLRKVGLEEAYDNRQTVKIGMDMIDLAAQINLVKAAKHEVAGQDATWFLEPTEEFLPYALSIKPERFSPPLDQGSFQWVRQEIHYGDGQKVDIVKKARRDGMLHNYRPEGNESWYAALNRLNKQDFILNQALFDLVKNGTHPYVPPMVPSNERKSALVELNKIDRKKLTIEELRTKKQMEWLSEYTDVDSDGVQKIARLKGKQQAEDWQIEKSKPWKDVLSAWSKRFVFEKIIRIAGEHQGKTLNWLYQMDTRGRAYTVQQFLSPMGDDLSKALILFNNPKQIDLDHFKWNCANHAGEDKASFAGRIKWFDENADEIYAIGCGEWTKLAEKIKSEKKSRWQFIAFCMEWVKIKDYIDANGTVDGFKSGLLSSSDGTNQGLQLLSMLGADDKTAPFVNIANSKTGKVGDIYAEIGRALSENLRELKTPSETIQNILDLYPTGHKMWRKLAKRPTMTAAYSATKFGMELQTYEDKDDHGCDVVKSLRMSECRVIGSILYKTCEQQIEKGYELMNWMQEGVTAYKGGAIISWTLPDGFKAYSNKSKVKKSMVDGKIGEQEVNVQVIVPTGVADKRAHKAAISPQIIHSLDGYLLRTLVNQMPVTANCTTLHDCFSTDFCHTEDLRLAALYAYAQVSNREYFKAMTAEAFGTLRELPTKGKWVKEDLVDAIYLVC